MRKRARAEALLEVMYPCLIQCATCLHSLSLTLEVSVCGLSQAHGMAQGCFDLNFVGTRGQRSHMHVTHLIFDLTARSRSSRSSFVGGVFGVSILGSRPLISDDVVDLPQLCCQGRLQHTESVQRSRSPRVRG